MESGILKRREIELLAKIISKKYTVGKTYSKPYLKTRNTPLLSSPHSSDIILSAWQWLMAHFPNFSNKYLTNMQCHILTEVAQNKLVVLKKL